MKRRVTKAGTLRLLLLPLILAAGVLISPGPAVALNVYDYFTINYDTEFSQDAVGGGEVFYATVQGTADCKQDMPLTINKGYITSRVVAQHQESGHKVTLNPSYTIDIEPFPNEQGETTEAHVVISLAFPGGSPAGSYDIAGELIEAKVQSTLGFWLSVTPYLPSVEELGSVTYWPGDEDFTIIGSVFELSSYLDNGILTRDSVFLSDDGRCQLIINQDTLCLTEDGEPLSELTMTGMEIPPAPPEGYCDVGLIYQLGPGGATFDPPLMLTLTYDASMMPTGVAESELVIGMWDEINEWVILEESSLGPGTGNISAALSHFSAFTILAPTPMPSPADFTVTDLAIAPEEANIGEEITVSVLVANLGDLEGMHLVTLKINDGVAATSDITLAGDSSQRVSFTIQKGVPGIYNVDVNGLLGTFKVAGAAPANWNWWLIGGIIAAVAAAITIPLVLRRRRRRF